MDELSERSLTGARFHRVDLAGASLDHVDLSGANFYEVDLSRVKMRGAYLRDVDIAGDLDSMRVNGVDVGPLIEAELDRRHPGAGKAATERRRRVPRGMGRDRAAVGRDRRPGPTARPRPDARPGRRGVVVHRDLRHLVFATDAWVRRAMLGDPSPWDPLDLP